jgi:hypothetical protein
LVLRAEPIVDFMLIDHVIIGSLHVLPGCEVLAFLPDRCDTIVGRMGTHKVASYANCVTLIIA